MADSWENNVDEEASKPALNPNAASFSFNPNVSSWAPKFNPPVPTPPAPTTTSPAPAPTRQQKDPASPPQKAPASPPQKVPASPPQKGPTSPPQKKSGSTPQKLSESPQQKVTASPTVSSNGVGERVEQIDLNAADEEEEGEDIEVAEVGDEDPRENLNLVFIGHVDAGKSTLCGSILYLMDQVDKRTIERYEKEAKSLNRDSWFLAFIMDTSEEERSKGKTIEVGRAHFETENKRFTILDAPGHKNYVPNMIQGASQADVGVLVISARKGEFETGFERGGQTREHAMLAKTLGVNKLVVVINKMDEAEWRQERFDECVEKLKPFLKQCGYAVKRDVFFIPIAGLLGHNIKVKLDSVKAPWYTGEALIPFLDQLQITGRNPDGPLRVPVLDRYHERGTVCLGKVESGILKTGSSIMILPTNVLAQVSQVFINEKAVKTAKPGENVTIRLSCNIDDLMKGFVLCEKKNPCRHVKSFIAQVALVDMLEHRPLLTAGYKCILHVHTAAEECMISKLIRQVDKKTGQPMKKKCTFARQGDIVICRVLLEQSISVETFENMPQMGRFTLRDEGKSIAIGKILKLDDE